MKIICAWCEKLLGEKEPKEDESTSHGICPSCQRKLIEKHKRLRKAQAIAKRKTVRLSRKDKPRTDRGMANMGGIYMYGNLARRQRRKIVFGKAARQRLHRQPKTKRRK